MLIFIFRKASKDDRLTPCSSDEIAAFEVYASLINSERETLWARHNTLLLANSLIIGALAISPATLWQNKWGPAASCSVGYNKLAYPMAPR